MASSFPSLDRSTPVFPLPSIPEDTLDYAIYLPGGAEEPGQDAESWGTQITRFVTSLLVQPWLWNKDAWELKVVSGADQARTGSSRLPKGEARLQGRMRVGDAVDDEWLVVWLLREVSKRWPELVISARDTDGEFLLIEGANELPSWVSPENADNRVWISGEHLHLIPLTVRSSAASVPKILDEEEEQRRFDPDAYLSPEDGVKAARTGRYRAPQKLEDAIWARISGYPKAMRNHLHSTKAYLPVLAAKALKAHPELIQRAVEAFYVRDPAQLRVSHILLSTAALISQAAAKMTHFPPSPSILTSVLMTRPAYAQLQGQVFHPPRSFGPEWTVPDEKSKEDERRWRDLGVKIATGFEIMYREGGRRGLGGVAHGGDEATRQDPGYARYLQNLGLAGWFGGEKEGSAAWKAREEEALKGWKNVRSADTADQRPSFAALVDSSANEPVIEAEPNNMEDSTAWLEISPEDLDGLLSKVSGSAPKASPSTVPKDDAMDITDEDGKAITGLARKVQDFVGGEGDLAGARFADELSDDDFDNLSSDGEDEDVEMTPAEKEEKKRSLVPGLPAEEWGLKTVAAPSSTSKSTSKISDPVQMRPPKLAKDEYDGVISESDSSSDEDEPPLRTRRTPGVNGPKNQMASVSQIEDEEDQARKDALGWEDDFDEAMIRRATEDPAARKERRRKAKLEKDDMDVDVDMENELDDFMKFTKDMLGIDEEQWERIVESREERGAFVPPTGQQSESFKPAKHTKVKFAPPPADLTEAASTKSDEPNMDLDTFEKVMAAMDAELARSKPKSNKNTASESSTARFKHPSKGGSSGELPTEEDLDNLSEDELAEMDREIRNALRQSGEQLSDDEELGEDDAEELAKLDGDSKREYRMMKDFLESYRSQGGQAGAVGNLLGRLGEQGDS